MRNFQAVGFVFTLAIVGLGLDYHQQTLKSELKLGELSASAYIDTITGRFGDVQEAKAAKVAERERKSRLRDGARPYLPEAPEGWTRREWAAGDNSAITTPKREMEDFEKEAFESSTVLKNMAAASEKRAEEAKNAQTWVYERGDETVSVQVRYAELPKGNTISANAMTMIAGNMSALSLTEGWGVIQGVAYGANSSMLADEPKKYRTLNAVIGFGSEVRLNVRTNTSDAATREILAQIDYDGLNALLPRPLAHVGSGAREIPLALQAQMASKMLDLRDDLIQQRTEAATNWLQSASSHEDAMTLALRSAGFNIDGSMADADAALEEALQDAESRGVAIPDDHASLDQLEDGDTVKTAIADLAVVGTPQSSDAPGVLVSKRLPEEKILKLLAMSEADRSVAVVGLSMSARRFAVKNGLPEDACVFSTEKFRVECAPARDEANAGDSAGSDAAKGALGSLLSNFMGGGKEEAAPAEKVKPRRLQLSGGKSCLDNSVGGFCGN